MAQNYSGPSASPQKIHCLPKDFLEMKLTFITLLSRYGQSRLMGPSTSKDKAVYPPYPIRTLTEFNASHDTGRTYVTT